MRQRINFALASLLLASACGGAIDQLDAGEDDATAASYALFTVRRDERKCAAPACGGWWATTVRTDATPRYVSDLDFSRAHPFEQIVIEGHTRGVGPRRA